MKWQSKRRFCFVQVDQTYQPWHKDTTCLHVVYILQPPTSPPTTKSTQDTMVIAPDKYLSPLPAGRYGRTTKLSTRWRHRANEGQNDLEAERARALIAYCSLQSKEKLATEKRQETHLLSNKQKETWMRDYVDRKTTVVRKRVQDAETAIMQ